MIHNDSLLDSIARMNSVAPVKAYPVRAEAR
jgi:hypothetical protein